MKKLTVIFVIVCVTMAVGGVNTTLGQTKTTTPTPPPSTPPPSIRTPSVSAPSIPTVAPAPATPSASTADEAASASTVDVTKSEWLFVQTAEKAVVQTAVKAEATLGTTLIMLSNYNIIAMRAADFAKALDEAGKQAERAAEEEAEKEAIILEQEEAKRVAEAREEAKKQAILEDEARKKKQAHLEQEERDRKIAEDKKRRLQGDPNRDWWCLVVICDPINRDDPGGFPRIVIDIRGPGPGPGPGPNPGNQDTETAELVRPCFAAGVIVSPADDQEDSDEEQVTDSSEVLCSGAAASSPLTKVESITPKTFASLWDEGGPFRKDPPNAVLAWGSGEDRKESKVILVGGQIDDGMSKYDIQYIGGDVPEFIMDKPKLTIAPVSCVQELTAFDTVILCN